MDGWRKRGVCHTLTNRTHVFEHVHEAWSKAPGFVSVALKGADSDLGGALRSSSHHVDSIVHQSCFSLEETHACHHHRGSQITSGLLMQRHRMVSQSAPKNAAIVLQTTWRAIKLTTISHSEHNLVSNCIQSTFLIVHTIRKQHGELLYSDSSVCNEGLRLNLCKGPVQFSKGYVFMYLNIFSQSIMSGHVQQAIDIMYIK